MQRSQDQKNRVKVRFWQLSDFWYIKGTYESTVELCYSIFSGSAKFSTLYSRHVISNTIQYDSSSHGTVRLYIAVYYSRVYVITKSVPMKFCCMDEWNDCIEWLSDSIELKTEWIWLIIWWILWPVRFRVSSHCISFWHIKTN